MRLTLKDHGYPYYKIMDGKRWIGRTYRAADNTYTCMIGGTTYHAGASSHEQAFAEGAARWLGHASAAALAAANAATRQRNADARDRARAAAQQYMSATTLEDRLAALDRIMGRRP